MNNAPIMMEALGYQNYGGKWFRLGDPIPVESELHARDMEAMRLAKRIKPVAALLAPPQPEHAPTRSMEAANNTDTPAPAPAADAPTPDGEKMDAQTAERRSGKYRHRALQARS